MLELGDTTSANTMPLYKRHISMYFMISLNRVILYSLVHCLVLAAAMSPSPFSVKWKNKIAICAIMRNERSEDVREWLQYHR